MRIVVSWRRGGYSFINSTGERRCLFPKASTNLSSECLSFIKPAGHSVFTSKPGEELNRNFNVAEEIKIEKKAMMKTALPHLS